MHAWLTDKLHMCMWHPREPSKIGETCKHALPLNVFLTSRIAKTKKLMLLCWQVVDIRDINYIWYKRYQLPRWLRGKESACQCRRCRRPGFDPWVGKIPWNRKWQPTPIFLPGKFYGPRSLKRSQRVGHDWAWYGKGYQGLLEWGIEIILSLKMLVAAQLYTLLKVFHMCTQNGWTLLYKKHTFIKL